MNGDIAIDRERNIYVISSNTIAKYDNKGSFLIGWHENLENPSDIVVDHQGDIYVLDQSPLGIQKFSSNGTFLTRWGGNRSTNDETRRGQRGLAVDKEGNVMALGKSRNGIEKFSGNGTLITSWGKPATDLSKFGNDEFLLLSGIVVDKQGNVYIGDIGNFRIQKFTSNGTFITGWKTYEKNINEAWMIAISQTMDLAVDKEGDVYVLDEGLGERFADDPRNCSVQKFSSNGTLITSFKLFDENNEPFFPNGIDIDKEDHVYLHASSPDRVLKFDSNGTLKDNIKLK